MTDRLRYLPGRPDRQKAHLITPWQDGEEVRTARCGIESGAWLGGADDAQMITAYKRKPCGNCLEVYRVNEGRPYVAPFYPEGLERKSA